MKCNLKLNLADDCQTGAFKTAECYRQSMSTNSDRKNGSSHRKFNNMTLYLHLVIFSTNH